MRFQYHSIVKHLQSFLLNFPCLYYLLNLKPMFLLYQVLNFRMGVQFQMIGLSQPKSFIKMFPLHLEVHIFQWLYITFLQHSHHWIQHSIYELQVQMEGMWLGRSLNHSSSLKLIPFYNGMDQGKDLFHLSCLFHSSSYLICSDYCSIVSFKVCLLILSHEWS